MDISKATRALESIDPKALIPYRDYFEKITPKDETEIFRRFLFAFSSVHTTWKYNVNLFVGLYDMKWMVSMDALRSVIVESRAGLTEGRTKSIWKFSKEYWENPKEYLKREDELWPQYRDRIQAKTLGLGHAKSSFANELVYPNEAEVICGDTHQLQLYGLPIGTSPSQKTYGYVEAHWVAECKRLGIAPVAARWYLWDRKQGHENSRYWSYCIEGNQPSLVCPRQLELFTYTETGGTI